MVAVALDCFAANAKFLRDSPNTVFASDQAKHYQFAISKAVQSHGATASAKLPHGQRSDCGAHINFARCYGFNRAQ